MSCWLEVSVYVGASKSVACTGPLRYGTNFAGYIPKQLGPEGLNYGVLGANQRKRGLISNSRVLLTLPPEPPLCITRAYGLDLILPYWELQ